MESTTDELVAGITLWINCESPSHAPQTLVEMAGIITDQAQAAGLTVHSQELDPATGPLLHITNRAAGDTRPGILILAHLDTVHPVGALAQNPCRIEGDRLYGPG
ncbi:MAG: hypothetical protein WDA70_13315, partial [Lysobacteraceae bacterium]